MPPRWVRRVPRFSPRFSGRSARASVSLFRGGDAFPWSPQGWGLDANASSPHIEHQVVKQVTDLLAPHPREVQLLDHSRSMQAIFHHLVEPTVKGGSPGSDSAHRQVFQPSKAELGFGETCRTGGFATARAGDDADWSIAGGDRLLLRGGEAISHTARSNGVLTDDEVSANEDSVVAMGMRVLSFKEEPVVQAAARLADVCPRDGPTSKKNVAATSRGDLPILQWPRG